MTHSGMINSRSKRSIRKRSMLALGPLLFISLPLAAEIYRCEIDGVIVFSDRPCQDSTEPYQAGRSLSISGSIEDLEETEARNQAWLESQAEKLEARRAARAATTLTEPLPAAARPAVGSGFGDWGVPYLEPRSNTGQRGQRERHAGQRGPGERGPRDRELPDTANPQDRFSALRGRQPGSRRDP